jgi:hypothetical protein
MRPLSVEILYDESDTQAVLICNTTDSAFGPVFRNVCETGAWFASASDFASAFCRLAYERHGDPRRMEPDEMSSLKAEVDQKIRRAAYQHARDDDCILTEDDQCIVCTAIWHRAGCAECLQHIYHAEACPVRAEEGDRL